MTHKFIPTLEHLSRELWDTVDFFRGRQHYPDRVIDVCARLFDKDYDDLRISHTITSPGRGEGRSLDWACLVFKVSIRGIEQTMDMAIELDHPRSLEAHSVLVVVKHWFYTIDAELEGLRDAVDGGEAPPFIQTPWNRADEIEPCIIALEEVAGRVTTAAAVEQYKNNKDNTDDDRLTVTQAAHQLIDAGIIDGLDLKRAKARVSKACADGMVPCNGNRRERRIDPDKFNTWLMDLRRKEGLAG